MSELVDKYAKTNGALQVWISWRDKMLEQKREVNTKFMTLPIPERDMELDAKIAKDVIEDFLTWIQYEAPFIYKSDLDALQAKLDEAEKELNYLETRVPEYLVQSIQYTMQKLSEK